jgi:dimethyl sulfoxide reductase iron-sulfur subunit
VKARAKDTVQRTAVREAEDPAAGTVVHRQAVEIQPPATAQRQMNRRRFLSAMAALGAAAGVIGTGTLDHHVVAGAVAKKAVKRAGSKPLPQWMMIVDLRYCNGCRTCTKACQAQHYLPADVEWIKVYTMTDTDGQSYFLPRPCQMCEDPPCEAVCPVGATFRTDEGLVLINQDVCIGCRTCMAACPYETRYFNSTVVSHIPKQPFRTSPEWPVPQVKTTVGKCIWCAARLPAGMLPACVSACGMGVLYIGDLTTDIAVNGLGTAVKISEFLEKNDAYRLKETLGTNPRVYYIPGHGQDWHGTGT